MAVMCSSTSGSNYWTVDIRAWNEASASTVSNTSFTTASDTNDYWTVHEITGISELVSSSVDMITIKATKTGSPGALYWAAPIVEYTY
jgi:hypothetical protein